VKTGFRGRGIEKLMREGRRKTLRGYRAVKLLHTGVELGEDKKRRVCEN